MKLFTKTWKRDLFWLKWAFRSVYKYCDEPVVWHVVTEDDTCAEVRAIADECAKNSTTSHNHQIIVHGLGLWPEVSLIKDSYMGQQWIKMMAHKVIGDDLVWNWDSDVFAQKHFSEADFLGANGLPIYWFSKLDKFKGSVDYGTLRQRADLVQTMNDNKPVSCEWMRCMPMPLIGKILREGARYALWGKSLQECIAGNRALSEFNVIGQFANEIFPNEFDWRDPDVSGPAWAGSMKSSELIDPRPGVDVVFQNWSWGGPSPEIRHWIQQQFGDK